MIMVLAVLSCISWIQIYSNFRQHSISWLSWC